MAERESDPGAIVGAPGTRKQGGSCWPRTVNELTKTAVEITDKADGNLVNYTD